ncbi:MAG: prepilin-type N-terminal cleavage/methylation domain-containing protein [Bdellovibrionales bacterium]|nr:prepilin-type N-terminal cleavage/methylation domain-containing protein [Bdellovibrionales bacterium]
MKNNLQPNNYGFTLIEIMIAVSMFVFFILSTASFLGDISLLTNKTIKKTEGETDLAISVMLINKVLNDAAPSFNLVKNNLDDYNREFFEYFSDVSTEGAEPNEVLRKLTLSEQSRRLDFTFAVYNRAQFELIHYSPMSAYAAVTPDPTMERSSPLTYVGINQGNILSSKYPELWQSNNLFLLRVPIQMRFVSVAGTVNMFTPPREYSFVGKIVNNELISDTDLQNRFYTKHPATGDPILSADAFFRNIPAVGGGSPLVLIQAIELVKISLVLNQTTSRYDLHFFRYTNSNSVDTLIAPDIKEIVFKRESISRPVIQVTVSKY